jgi:hypothetical protein
MACTERWLQKMTFISSTLSSGRKAYIRHHASTENRYLVRTVWLVNTTETDSEPTFRRYD